MPLPQQSCEVSDDVCCTVMWDVANFVLNSVYDGIVDCFPLDCNGEPMPFTKYVTMGNGDDGIVDSLAVAIQTVSPTTGSSDNTGVMKGVTLFRAAFDVRLREGGWPIVSTNGGVIQAPDPAMQHAISRHAYAHGEKMYRVLRSMVSSHTVLPSAMPRPGFANLAPLRALQPLGGAVGFATTLQVDLPWGIAGY